VARYSTFLDNMERAALLNNRTAGANKFGITKFSDLTSEEFKQMYTGFTPASAPRDIAGRVHVVPKSFAAPTTYDWRDHGAVSPVKDQGQCGSCWAFSAMEQVESQWFLSKGSLPLLSAQQLVDCDTVDAGCDGGDTPSAYDYIKKAGGLEKQSDYAYTGRDGSCKFSSSKVAADVNGYTYATPPCYSNCKTQDENTLKSALASTAPVSICVDADIWQLYQNGVIEAKDGCDFGYYDLNHCVQLVGYNTDSKGVYWIVRNSWNTDWGDDGYIYLRFGSNVCGVADEATFVTI